MYATSLRSVAGGGFVVDFNFANGKYKQVVTVCMVLNEYSWRLGAMEMETGKGKSVFCLFLFTDWLSEWASLPRSGCWFCYGDSIKVLDWISPIGKFTEWGSVSKRLSVWPLRRFQVSPKFAKEGVKTVADCYNSSILICIGDGMKDVCEISMRIQSIFSSIETKGETERR